MGFFIDTAKIFNEQKKVIRITVSDIVDESNIRISGKRNKPSEVPMYVGSDERASHNEGRVKIYHNMKEKESVIIIPIDKDKNPRFLNDKSKDNFDDYPKEVKEVLKQYIMDNREELIAQCKNETEERRNELQAIADKVIVDKSRLKKFTIDDPKN